MSREESQLGIETIFEFYERWPGLRQYPAQMVGDERLPPELRETLAWMIVVIDRVGPDDLHPDVPGDAIRTRRDSEE
ncbi:hypothetical protein [Tropicimonas sp.]|uniref:hypothetical protein n=1 Tax=Tropicimonas sp. TaxID=2067044 RepID=UPI003A847A37